MSSVLNEAAKLVAAGEAEKILEKKTQGFAALKAEHAASSHTTAAPHQPSHGLVGMAMRVEQIAEATSALEKALSANKSPGAKAVRKLLNGPQ